MLDKDLIVSVKHVYFLMDCLYKNQPDVLVFIRPKLPVDSTFRLYNDPSLSNEEKLLGLYNGITSTLKVYCDVYNFSPGLLWKLLHNNLTPGEIEAYARIDDYVINKIKKRN